LKLNVKKLVLLTFILVFSFSLVAELNNIPFVHATTVLVYSQALENNAWSLANVHPSSNSSVSASGQTWQANQSIGITQISFDLKRYGSPTVNMTANIYAASSTVPSGSSLATSLPVNMSTVSSSSIVWVNFTFSTPYTLINGNWYAFDVEVSNTGGLVTSLNFVYAWYQGSDVIAGDNFVYDNSGWFAQTSYDTSMMLYGQAITTVPITFTSTPTGSGFITINGTAQTTPYTIASANIGDVYTIAALSPVSIGGYNYTFSSWNDTGVQTHTITVSTATTYTASYTQQWGGGIAQVLGPFYGNSTSSSTVTDTLGSTPFNNTLLVLTFVSSYCSFAYSTVSSISETGTSWQQLEQNKTNYYDSEIWATNYTSGASLTVTINLSVSNGQAEAIICGYQGVNYFDRSASNIGFGNTNQVTGITLQTTQANELCVGTIDT